MTDAERVLGYPPQPRDVPAARAAAQELSSELLDALALRGTVSGDAPEVTGCAGLDERAYYRIHHPWTLTGVPRAALEDAMARLDAALPGRGWKPVSYGPDVEPGPALGAREVVATSDREPFSVRVRLVELAAGARLSVDLVSACFRVPDGAGAADDAGAPGDAAW